jgi:DNA-binding beta-propeller fold protein YncE
VLPQLREIEQRFAKEVVVVGVHSGKYTTERDTSRIREAALRLGNTHPIVNDRQFRVWREFTVKAWPTLAVIDPHGVILGMHAGEFTAEQLGPFIGRVVDAYDQTGDLDHEPRVFTHDQPATHADVLRYPGKVAVEAMRRNARVAIADTGHHRVLIGHLGDDGRSLRLDRVIGTGAPGFENGKRGSLNAPQGLSFDGDVLYVADTGNHAVRRVAISTGEIQTLAGTGRQLRTRADLESGSLSSPWDIALGGSMLYVAMAGTHQLYAIDTATGEVDAHAGNGREDIVDGRHPEAALAQPMGIAISEDRIYFADAESSAIRWASTDPHGAVHTIIGTGLFEFGDKDGVGDEVRMQHQQGLAVHPSGRLLVADSYNDALKWVDPESRRTDTWLRGFNEPSGVAIGEGLVYVADTNAHRIAVVDEQNGTVDTLRIDT